MIKLDVENYCQECSDFKPEKETTTLYAGEVPISHMTTVYCKYRDRCASIAKYLEEKKLNLRRIDIYVGEMP